MGKNVSTPIAGRDPNTGRFIAGHSPKGRKRRVRELEQKLDDARFDLRRAKGDADLCARIERFMVRASDELATLKAGNAA